MPLTQGQCAQFNDFLGRRPFDWDKRIAKDRKPHNFLYTAMYKTSTWPPFTGTTHLHEKVYVNRANDPGLWDQFQADPCLGAPCDPPRQNIGYGVDQLRYDIFNRRYQTPPFCLDQLNTIEEVIPKLAAIAEGLKELPEDISSDFLRLLTLRKAGTAAQGAGLFLCGLQDAAGGPLAIDVTENMFVVTPTAAAPGNTANSLFVNLNANGQLTAQGITTTALLAAAMGQLTMEYLGSHQESLAAEGYHDKDFLVEGGFAITTDQTTRRRLLAANPALTAMYQAADFAKGGAFYSYGISRGCGDWLFKEDKQQLRFGFRSDLDGLDLTGVALANAIWVQQVWPYENVAATFGSKPQFSTAWLNAPIRMFHCYNRDAREIFVGDITSVNDEMKFGLARSFMGEWKWYSPDFFQYTDPTTGVTCSFKNEDHGKGYWMGDYRMGIKTVYPEIERIIFALGENTPSVRVPRTNTAPLGSATYQHLLAYNPLCGDPGSATVYNPPQFFTPPED